MFGVPSPQFLDFSGPGGILTKECECPTSPPVPGAIILCLVKPQCMLASSGQQVPVWQRPYAPSSWTAS